MKLKYFLLFLILLFIVGCYKQNQITYQPAIEKQTGNNEQLIIQKPECTLSTDCKPDEYCSNEKCLKIDCSNGYVVNHICKKYECTTDDNCRTDEVCSNTKCSKLNCQLYMVPQDHKCKYQFFSDYKKYITPYDPLVSNKVDELTNGIYSEEYFGKNLDKIFYYATSIFYRDDLSKWGVLDYWQNSQQTIEDGKGDCEDHAILLQSLIEALLFKTYGFIPNETAYVIVGCVDTNHDGIEDGCHAWNIIDASKLPKQAYTFSIVDSKKEAILSKLNIVLNDITIEGREPSPRTVEYDPSKDIKKTAQLISIYWKGRKWVELESTWYMPLSYYENRGYPYVSVNRAFNSQEDYYYPDFLQKDKKPTIFEDTIAFLTGFLKMVYTYIVNLLT